MPTPRKPLALKLAQGTARPCREMAPEVHYDLAQTLPEAPQHLNADGARLWHDLGAQLLASGVLQIVDLSMLEMLASCWARYRQKIKAGLPVLAAEENQLRLLFGEFGCSPSSRGRVKVGKETKSQNRFAERGKRPNAAA